MAFTQNISHFQKKRPKNPVILYFDCESLLSSQLGLDTHENTPDVFMRVYRNVYLKKEDPSCMWEETCQGWGHTLNQKKRVIGAPAFTSSSFLAMDTI